MQRLNPELSGRDLHKKKKFQSGFVLILVLQRYNVQELQALAGIISNL